VQKGSGLMRVMRFRDRKHAGQELAVRLLQRAADGELVRPVVLALPRGGVPVAAEIARVLDAPLDVLVVRKIGVPGQPETGIGAVAGEDPPLFDPVALEMTGLTEDRLAPDVARERAELRRREELYRAGRPAPEVRGRTVILVDDGLATGVTARAALRQLRRQAPARLILAVPVCGTTSAGGLGEEADELLCLRQPAHFHAVGQWYEDFDQVSDETVVATLRQLSAAP
jgi:predicted phosphoribosyltransferase